MGTRLKEIIGCLGTTVGLVILRLEVQILKLKKGVCITTNFLHSITKEKVHFQFLLKPRVMQQTQSGSTQGTRSKTL